MPLQHLKNQLGQKILPLFSASSLLMAAANLYAEDFSVTRSAYAYAPDDNRLLYIEKHEEIWRENKLNRSLIRYFSPENKLLAEKKIDFTQSSTAPTFELNDLRDGYFEAAKPESGKIKLSARRNAQQNLKEKLVNIPAPIVIDGGFDQFVKLRWDELQKGKVVHFNFVAPIEQDFFSFSVRKKADTRFAERAASVLEMRAESALVRMFVKPITLTYDQGDQSLLQFEGMTNLNNEHGKSYVARLVYPLQDVNKMATLQPAEKPTIAARE